MTTKSPRRPLLLRRQTASPSKASTSPSEVSGAARPKPVSRSATKKHRAHSRRGRLPPFPLEESSAVSGFEVESAGKLIKGRSSKECEKKAFEKYDEAMSEGHGGVSSSIRTAPNIFTAQPASATCFPIRKPSVRPALRLRTRTTWRPPSASSFPPPFPRATFPPTKMKGRKWIPARTRFTSVRPQSSAALSYGP